MCITAQLDTFLCVADAGSFNKAAERLYISPPAVIKQINLLEEGLGLQLFVRTHRGLQLTPGGPEPLPGCAIHHSVLQRLHHAGPQRHAGERKSDSYWHLPHDAGPVPGGSLAPGTAVPPRLKFQLVPFDNTPRTPERFLSNLGQNIDVVAGIFDDTMLELRRCAGLELSREPICCAVSAYHPLAQKDSLTVQDLYGEKLMLIRRGWSHYVDLLRDDIWKNHPQIQIVDFDFYDTGVFNDCENRGCVLMAVESWHYVHPLLKILPVDWGYTIPFGLLHAPEPAPLVASFLETVQKAAPRA